MPVLMLQLCAAPAFSQPGIDRFTVKFVCFLDLDYERINREQPLQSTRVIYPCFVKDSSGWRVFKNEDYDAAVYQKKYYPLYGGPNFYPVWVKYRYDTIGKKIMDLNQQEIRKGGAVSGNWHIFQNIPSYPPLIVLNRRPGRQYYKLNDQQPGPHVRAWIDRYLEERSVALKLGPLPYFSAPFVDMVRGFWQVSEDVFLVQADINLQVHCITDTVPFNNADTYPWTLEQRSGKISGVEDDILDSSKRENFTIIDDNGKQMVPYDGNSYFADEKGSFHKKWKTTDCWFLKTGKQFFYVGRSLHFMGMLDMDDDGSVELLFRRQAHGFISYIMVCNNFSTVLERKAIEWW